MDVRRLVANAALRRALVVGIGLQIAGLIGFAVLWIAGGRTVPDGIFQLGWLVVLLFAGPAAIGVYLVAGAIARQYGAIAGAILGVTGIVMGYPVGFVLGARWSLDTASSFLGDLVTAIVVGAIVAGIAGGVRYAVGRVRGSRADAGSSGATPG